MRLYTAAYVTMVFAAFIGVVAAHAEDAKVKDACIAAEQTIGQVKTWKALYTYSKTYDCDNGAIAEGISDKVEQLMTHDWEALSSVAAKLRSDKAFRTLLLNHIDETWSSEDIEIARQNAASHCPQGLDAFCKTVVSAVADVEKYSAEDAAKDSK